MPTRAEECAEAICGALYRFEFDYLGDTRDSGGHSTWFTRGTRPKDVRIEVNRATLAAVVRVRIEFRNFRNQLGTIDIQVHCGSNYARSDVEAGTERAVMKCLDVFRDVLRGGGVAGPEGLANSRSVSTSDVPSSSDDD